jgi:lysophospholipase L1-like esterase
MNRQILVCASQSRLEFSPIPLRGLLLIFGLTLIVVPICPAEDAPGKKEPVIFTTAQDHQNMMDQLGITKLRPGRSADEKSPNVANYDESKANPYPHLPHVLKMENGEQVTTREQWYEKRRPEIVELLEREVYGCVPPNVPAVKWEVRETREIDAGGKPATQTHIVGVVDNSACPEINVNISMSLTLPKDVKGPVPVLMSFGWTPFEPSPFNFGGRGRQGNGPRPPSKEDKLIAAGWGCAILNPSTVQDDTGGFQPRRFGPNANPNAEPTGAGLTRGIVGLVNRGQPRKPDDWGALRAWGWGASRGLDYLQSLPAVDAKQVGIAGVSRYGKAALVAMAFDQRFAMGLIASSGAGGTKLYRRNFGESLENLASSGGYHWMAGNYLKYSAEESAFGRKTAADLPVDSHETLALCAPRPTFISHGIPEKGDANWLDHQGSFMAAVAAQPVYRLLGARDLGRSDDYNNEKMPAVNAELLDGQLAWRQHDGGHTDEPNVEHFIKWADRLAGRKTQSSETVASRSQPATGEQSAGNARTGDAAAAKNSDTNVAARVTTPGGADVPDVVRIKRPTTAEVTTAEKALADFIASADPQTKAVLKEFPALVEVRVPRPNSAIVPGLAPFFRQKHTNNVTFAKEGTANLLFMGDSITDFWRNESGPFAGKQVFDKYFGQWKVANFGIAGDTTQGVLYRLQNGEGEGFSPRAVMLMIGTNNTASNTAPEIAEGIGAVVLELQKRFPDAKILLLAVFPRGGPNDAVRRQIGEINQSISKLHDGKRVHYLDIGSKFLDSDGNIPRDIMGDALHPSPKGYEIWAEAVRETLGKLMEGEAEAGK